jgi:hypothetical protein
MVVILFAKLYGLNALLHLLGQYACMVHLRIHGICILEKIDAACSSNL